MRKETRQAKLIRWSVAARVEAMEDEKRYLQNLRAELGIQWRSVGDRINLMDTRIIAEKQSVPKGNL